MTYFINIETLDGVDRVLTFEPTIALPYLTLRVGDVVVLANNERNFDIHFDGRNYLRIWGRVIDRDDFVDDPLPFAVSIATRPNRSPLGSRTWTRRTVRQQGASVLHAGQDWRLELKRTASAIVACDNARRVGEYGRPRAARRMCPAICSQPSGRQDDLGSLTMPMNRMAPVVSSQMA
jgi:hypothetical protein